MVRTFSSSFTRRLLPKKATTRDGQTGHSARPGPGEARPVLGPARQARLGNRAGPSKPTGLILCPSPARSGPKRAGPARLARKKRAKKHVLVQKSGLNVFRGKRAVPG
jgi:hypothetical protein